MADIILLPDDPIPACRELVYELQGKIEQEILALQERQRRLGERYERDMEGAVAEFHHVTRVMQAQRDQLLKAIAEYEAKHAKPLFIPM